MTIEAIAQLWLDQLPAGRVFTAERIAYRNLLAGDEPGARIVPFRGEYYELARPELVRGLVYPVPDPAFLTGTVDLAALENGGQVVDCSDAFYGSPTNMIMPGRSRHMGEGWENARRRGPGNDFMTVKLGAPARLDQRQPVRRVAVDLVGAHRDEHRLGAVAATGLEEVEGAHRVGVEVVEGSARGQVVAGLGGGVDHQLVAPPAHHVVDAARDKPERACSIPGIEPHSSLSANRARLATRSGPNANGDKAARSSRRSSMNP